MVSQFMIQPSSTLPENEPVIQLSTNLLKKLNIPQKEAITIMAGMEQVTAKLILTRNNEETHMILNNICFSSLKLPMISIQLQAIYQNDFLILGPIVAIMTEVKINDDGSPLFGSIHSFCEEMLEYGQKHGGFYYVTNLARLLSKGFYFYQGKWIEDVIPKPNVIYNRIHSRLLEGSARFQHLKNEWEKDNVIFFNARFLSKWEVHETLIKSDQLKTFIPETTLLNLDVFEDWMTNKNDVFIKPETGSQGRKIIHVFKKDQHFHVEQTSFSESRIISFTTLNEVATLIEKWVENRRFLIQETIPLFTFEGKRIDFRFLCHKKAYGIWTVTSAVARMSSEGQFVSNISQGGTIHRPLTILKSVFNKERAQYTYRLMEELALEVSKVVSTEINGLIAELGIDIGVDSLGNPWLIEVNSKPSKQKESTTSHIRPSAKAICRFCTVLWIERSQRDDKTGNFNIDPPR